MIWAVVILMWVPAALFRGYVLSVLWSWFVVPTFHAQPIAVWQAMGISLIVWMMTAYLLPHSRKQGNDEAKEQVWVNFVASIVRSLLALGIGWLIKTLA